MNKENSQKEKQFVSKSKFIGVNNILPRVLASLGLDRHVQEQSLFSFWPSLLDPVYASRSMPLYIDSQGILVVAVENGSTAQDLSFLKAKLLGQLQSIAAGLGLTVKGMRFDLKHFSRSSTSEETAKIVENDDLDNSVPSEDELAAIKLDEKDRLEIACLKQELQATIEQLDLQSKGDTESSQMLQRITYLVEKRLRAQKWYVQQNMPVCKRCGEPLPRSYHNLNRTLCSYCVGA